jgi:hypothetical protein
VKLLWNGTIDGAACAGSLNITPFIVSCLRAPSEEEGEPLEGVLWNDEFPKRALEQLKRMAIVENIAGRSTHITFSIDESDGRLYLVDNDRIDPIVPDFETTMTLLARYAGADGLRERVVHENWRERVDADARLTRIAALA